MKITFTLTSAELQRRFLSPTPWRERLGLLLSFTSLPLLCAVSYLTGSWHGFSFMLLKWLTALYFVVGFLFAAAWVLKIRAARSNKSVPHSVEISETGLLWEESGGSLCCYSWTDLGYIDDLKNYFVFTSEKGQHLAVVPKSAFDSDDDAQSFFTQSCNFWEAAIQEQQDQVPGKDGSWPPPPRIGA